VEERDPPINGFSIDPAASEIVLRCKNERRLIMDAHLQYNGHGEPSTHNPACTPAAHGQKAEGNFG